MRIKKYSWVWRKLLPFALLVIVWQVFSKAADNPVILPGPSAVFLAMLSQMEQPGFVSAILLTVLRALSALALCMTAGILFAFAGRKENWFSSFLEQCVLFIRTLPNIAIIILILFWFERNMCVFLISFLLVFPVVYTSILEKLRQIDAEYSAVFTIYPQPLFVRILQVYLPMTAHEIKSCLISSSALCFKSTVMAEVLCQAAGGIGRKMQTARFDLDVAGVIGWTFWLLAAVSIMDWIFKKMITCLFCERKEKKRAENQCSCSCL